MTAGLCCLFFAASFWIFENRYFGWNAHPTSDAELIADGLVFVMLCIAAVAFGMEKN